MDLYFSNKCYFTKFKENILAVSIATDETDGFIRYVRSLKKFNYEKIPGYKKTLRICWYDIGRSGIKNRESFNIFVKKIPKEISHKEFHEY